MLRGVLLVVTLLLLAIHTAAAVDVSITPVAPPGLGDKISLFMGWIYYLAIFGSVAGIIIGAALLWVGKDYAKFVLVAAIISLAILASLNAILKAI